MCWRERQFEEWQEPFLFYKNSYLRSQVISEIIRAVKAVGARGAESLRKHVLHVVHAHDVTTQGHLGRLLGAAKLADVTLALQT